MEVPEDIQALVDQLGEALVEALMNDARGQELAARLQAHGYDLALGVEATISLTLRRPKLSEGEVEDADFSPEDRAFLHTFKIALE